MPYDWDTSAPWESNTLRVRDKRNGGLLNEYSRIAWQQAMRHPVHGWDYPPEETPYLFTHRFLKLVDLFGMAPDERILLVGEGAGYLQEAFRDGGYTNVWDIFDFTPLRSKPKRADVVGVEVNLRGGNTLAQIKSALTATTGGDTFDWIITDQLLQRLSDGHATILATGAEALLDPIVTTSNIIHLVIPDLSGDGRIQDPNYYFRTLAQYEALAPGHTIVSVYGDWEVY